MHNMIRIFSFLLLISVSFITHADSIAVIVHPDFDASSINDSKIKMIFTGRISSLTPYDLPKSSLTRERFYRLLTGKSLQQINADRNRLKFSGRSQAPEELINFKAVLRTIASNIDSIGYLETKYVDDRVKVLMTLE